MSIRHLKKIIPTILHTNILGECAAPSYENGGEDVSAEDVADAKRSVKLHVLVGSDTPGPSLRTMLSGPQDWSLGGEAKPSCVRSATPRRQSAKPQWDVGVGPRSTSILKF